MNMQLEIDRNPTVQAVGTPDRQLWADPVNTITHALQDAQLSAPERELVEQLIDRLRQS